MRTSSKTVAPPASGKGVPRRCRAARGVTRALWRSWRGNRGDHPGGSSRQQSTLWLVGALQHTTRTPASPLFAAGAVAGAHSSSGVASAPVPQGGAQASSVPSFTTAVAAQAGRYLVRTGTLDLEVANGQVAQAAGRVTAITQAFGGYVVSSEYSSSGSPVPLQAPLVPLPSPPGGPYVVATVRIPAASYDQAIASFSRLGRVQDLSTSAQDVTGQYVDLSARLSHYQAVEQRLLAFLARTTTVGQALAVQERIDATQLTVEELTGELKALRETVVYSTLTVSISEKPAPSRAVAGRSFPSAFLHSLSLIWVGARAALAGLGAALPFLALAALLGYGALLIARRARRARGGGGGGSTSLERR